MRNSADIFMYTYRKYWGKDPRGHEKQEVQGPGTQLIETGQQIKEETSEELLKKSMHGMATRLQIFLPAEFHQYRYTQTLCPSFAPGHGAKHFARCSACRDFRIVASSSNIYRKWAVVLS
jgi:hypothetical protein